MLHLECRLCLDLLAVCLEIMRKNTLCQFMSFHWRYFGSYAHLMEKINVTKENDVDLTTGKDMTGLNRNTDTT